jgi:hypothetical protein
MPLTRCRKGLLGSGPACIGSPRQANRLFAGQLLSNHDRLCTWMHALQGAQLP